MSTPKPRPKAKPTAGHSAPRSVRTRWTGFRPMYDYWGNEIRRFYQLETLATAVDYMLTTGKDRFVIPSVRDAMNSPTITALHFELFQEGRFQLIFHVKAVAPKKPEASFAMVVAKNHQECSVVAQNEHRILQTLHERAPELVVQPHRSGKIYLPDRHARRDMGREVVAYLTQWLKGFEELGIDKNLQLMINTKQRHVFTLAETEQLKGIMVEIIARSYDPKLHECMDMPEIASGDFVVKKSPGGKLHLRLIACRRMLHRIGPVGILDRLLKASWPWGTQTYYLAPAEADTLISALTRALGKEETRRWLLEYCAAIAGGKTKNRRPEFLEAFRRYLAEK